MQAAPGVYAVLVGSGFSTAAGMPTAWGVIQDLVRRIAQADGVNLEAAGVQPEDWWKATYGSEPRYDVLLGWWSRHPQPFALPDILALARIHAEAAARRAAPGTGPHFSDPRRALGAFSIPIRATTLWRWPFSTGVDYLACATLT